VDVRQHVELLPELADDDRVGLRLVDARAERPPEVVALVLHDVEPPPLGARVEPVGCDVVDVVLDRVVLRELRQRVEARPRVVVLTARARRRLQSDRRTEAVPRPILRGHALARADRREVVVPVEERAVRGRVVEDAVEDHPDAERLCVTDELVPVLALAEVGVDHAIVSRVVAVVRGRREDRVEEEHGHAELLQVRQLLDHAGEVAAVVVAAERPLATGARLPALGAVGRGVVAAEALGERAPWQPEHAITRPLLRRAVRERIARVVTEARLRRLAPHRVVRRVPVAEAVRKDLVDDTVLHPADGRAKARIGDRQRPAPVGRSVRRTAPAAVAHLAVVLVVDRARAVADDEAVEQRPGASGLDRRLPVVAAELEPTGNVRCHALHRLEALAVVPGAKRHAGDVVVEGPEPNEHVRAPRDRAARHAVEGVAAVVGEPVEPDVAVVRRRPRGRGDREDVRGRVVAERHAR
jgi:hypothetical protein